MQSFITRFMTLAAILSLSACATTTPNEHYLDAGARQHIKTVDAVLMTKQTQIGADIKQSSTLGKLGTLASSVTGLGVLPVLLDASVSGVRTVNANKMAKPMREKLEGHDYPYEFRKQIKQSLAGTTLSGVEDFDIVRYEYPGLRGLLITESDADAVLFVDMKYGFTPNFETLYLQSYAMLFPNHPELKQFQETPDRDRLVEFSDNIYRNQFSVGLSTKLEDATTAEHAAIWAEMSPEDLTEVLDVAALVMADTIAKDIGIDDLESDLNLIPEGYALNTKYNNHNRNFAKIRELDTGADTLPPQSAETDPDAEDVQDSRLEPEVKTGS